MKKITVKFLKKIGACESGIAAFESEYGSNSIALDKAIKRCIKDGTKENLQHANWLIVRCMTKRQKVQYAIYAAEQVLLVWEKKHTNNDAPRKAIEAAKAYLKNPCKKTKAAADAAAYAAADAADAAAYAAYAATAAYAADAADAAAYAAAYAAYAATDAAYAATDAAYAAAYAADAADAAADAADAADAMHIKILRYGLTLIK